MWRTILLVLILISVFPAVEAREYCCLGVMCQSYTSYEEAEAECPYGFASSYSCSHRVNHEFCQSCCVIEGTKYTVFSADHCPGILHPGQDCSDVIAKTYVRGQITGERSLESVTVRIGDESVLTLPDGRFAVPLPETGQKQVTITDDQGRYAGKTLSITVEGEDVDMGEIPLTPANTGEILRGSGTTDNQVEGYIQNSWWPLSVYTVRSGTENVTTSPNGFFRIDAQGSITIEGGSLEQPYTVSLPAGKPFVHIVCDDSACGVTATSVRETPTDTGTARPGPFIDFFLPAPPSAPDAPLITGRVTYQQETGGCQEVTSCYDYTSEENCEQDTNLCRVSSYGCTWEGFCKPVDALDNAAYAPCSQCDEIFSTCTSERCGSISGACTYENGNCELDEVIACGYPGCRNDITDREREVRLERQLERRQVTPERPAPEEETSPALWITIVVLLEIAGLAALVYYVRKRNERKEEEELRRRLGP